LDAYARRLVVTGIAVNTRRTYSTGAKRYLQFCQQFQMDPLAVSEDAVLRFIAFLASQNLLVRKIKVYLASVRSWYINVGLPVPLLFTTRVKLALKSLERDDPVRPNCNSFKS
jgi:hypothetical protein